MVSISITLYVLAVCFSSIALLSNSCSEGIVNQGSNPGFGIPLNVCLASKMDGIGNFGLIYGCSASGYAIDNVYGNLNCSGNPISSTESTTETCIAGTCAEYVLYRSYSGCNRTTDDYTMNAFTTGSCQHMPDQISSGYQCTNSTMTYMSYSGSNCDISGYPYLNLTDGDCAYGNLFEMEYCMDSTITLPPTTAPPTAAPTTPPTTSTTIAPSASTMNTGNKYLMMMIGVLFLFYF